MRKWLSPLLLILLIPAAVRLQTPEVVGRVYYRATIDDRVHIVVKGDRVETRTVSGKENPDGFFSFTYPLPRSMVVVDVIRKEGRGTVKVIQQPTAENDYTAIVEVLDDKGGEREYLLDIFWR